MQISDGLKVVIHVQNDLLQQLLGHGSMTYYRFVQYIQVIDWFRDADLLTKPKYGCDLFRWHFL